MTRGSVMRLRGLAVAGIALAGLLAANVFVSDAQVSPDVIQPAILRTVLLLILDKNDNAVGGCSGSFVTPAGLIMTAAHCVRATADEPKIGVKKGELYNPDGLLVVGVDLPDQVKPVIALVAQRVADNPQVDIALLRTVALLQNVGGKISPARLPGDFRVPAMVLGNSDAVRIGEPIAALGFPGNGGDSITVVQGHVTGFIADNNNQRLWLKHDASTAHGHSGGPVINARGEQIAVTSGGVPDQDALSTSERAGMINRMPSAWAQYLQGARGTASEPVPSAGAPGAAPGSNGGSTVPGSSAPGSPPPGLAPPAPVPSAGVVLRGRVIDATTGQGIPGAGVFLLRPGTSPQTAQQSDVVSLGQTDGNGEFQTRPAVPRGAAYPVIVLARGYRPITGTIQFSSNAPDVLVLSQPIPLQGQ
jgi:S1-C subfamily serine protease